MSDIKPDTGKVEPLPLVRDVRGLMEDYAEGKIAAGAELEYHFDTLAKKHNSATPAAVRRMFNAELRNDRVRLSDTGAPHEDPVDIINEFNDKYAVVNEDGKAFIYEQTYDKVRKRKVLVRITFENLKKLYLNRQALVTMPNGGATTQTAADLWLAHPERRQYLGGVVFDPTNKHAADQWNLWSGFTVEPQPGDWSMMQRHIGEVICGGNREYADYVFNWIARMFQYPEKQGEVAIVVRGIKGAGKGIVAYWIKRAWGQHGVHITNPRHLVGNFNAHLRDCVFLFADEAFFAGDKQHESVLKGIITEETNVIEGKGKDVIEAPNTLHVWMASNSDYVVPATAGERRFAVFDASGHQIGQLAYFEAINAQMENGGLAAMIYDMLHRDITRFNVRDVPQTEALADQKALNFDSVNQWLHEILCRGYVWESQHGAPIFAQWSDFVSIDLLWKSYEQWFGKHHKGYKTARVQFKHIFDKIYGEVWCKPGGNHLVGEIERLPAHTPSVALDQMATIWKDRPRGYRLGALIEARGVFQDHHKITGE